MPIYEYTCRSCQHQFETLVRSASPPPTCPKCESADLERLLSLPAVKSETTHQLALKAAKKRDAKRASENTRAQIEYERAHADHSP